MSLKKILRLRKVEIFCKIGDSEVGRNKRLFNGQTTRDITTLYGRFQFSFAYYYFCWCPVVHCDCIYSMLCALSTARTLSRSKSVAKNPFKKRFVAGTRDDERNRVLMDGLL